MAFPVTSYHIDADLAVKVQGISGPQIFRVCSALIAAASPVWRQQIYSGEYARPTVGDWALDMRGTNDSAAGLDIVFSIVHYKFHEIPAQPSIDVLHSVAQVVSKYACAHLLIPYIGKWIDNLNWHITTNEDRKDDDKVLCLSWVFGEARWFARVISGAASRATVDSVSAELIDGDGVSWVSQGLPADLIGKNHAAGFFFHPPLFL